MNITPIGCKCANLNNYSERKVNPEVSFCGGNTKFVHKTGKTIIRQLGLALTLLYLAVEAFLSENSANNKINSLILSIRDGYMAHVPMLDMFENDVNEMNSLLEKHSKNDNYSQFVKEALEFLRLNLKQNQGCAKEHDRLKIFEDGKNIHGYNWTVFLRAVENSAKAAISKSGKGINKEQLDKDIQAAREIMQNNAT